MNSVSPADGSEAKTRAYSAGLPARVSVHAIPLASRVKVIRDSAEIALLGGEWSRLLNRTPRASFFQSFEWLQARWRSLRAEDCDPRVVAVYDSTGAVTGLAPMMIQRKATPFGCVRKLRFPIDNWGSFYGPVGARPVETLRAVADHLLAVENRRERDFDVLEFTTVPAYGPADASERGEVPPIAAAAGAGEFSECSHVAMLSLESAGSWEEYWESRRAWKNRRRNVERCERRLRDLGEIGHIRHRPEPGGDPRWDWYEACEDLASRSWQDGLAGGDGDTLHHPAVRSFYRKSYRAAVAAGAADLNLLTLDGDPIAFVYGYHYRGYVDLVRIGFDPQYAKLAPGNALWTRLIRDSFDRGDRLLDFGPSCLDYKQFWMTGVETSYQIVHYAPTAMARAFRLARRVKKALPFDFASADHTNRESKEKVARERVGSDQ